MEMPLAQFVPGNLYRRRDLHAAFGGQQQGGISTPAAHPIVMLFTGDSGEQHGYADGWSDDGVFRYSGEGQKGDMEFVRGNLAIRDHVQNGKDLHLFAQSSTAGFVRYVGQMVCTGFSHRPAPDTDGNQRQAIIFELTPVEELCKVGGTIEPDPEETPLDSATLEQLRQRALSASASAKTPKERKAIARVRSRAIRLYVLKRAKGLCESCAAPAPFRTADGRPYLEPHHVRRLSDGGPDHPRWVVAVCPNCHRRAHYAEDGAAFNATLTELLGKIEGSTPE